ncbi:hypothetical protein DFH07DRAFT_300070 [Mycena maculata]|uniref:Uncharacterized protein n=1 Tax=Mycena maculata TaxID=230809 RepID=A0AAD7JRK4_9AGAR|nr:hypothetical protein DFH07DRAFT_300070 [Mycena maculata]
MHARQSVRLSPRYHYIQTNPDEKSRAGTNDPTAVRPQDLRFLENHVTNGGNSCSTHRSAEAENWLEQQHESDVLKSIRSVGLGGPIATMMSPEMPALVIFGSILDNRVLELAQTLSDVSMFAVMIRPLEDDPVAKFMDQCRETEADSEYRMVDSDYETDDESTDNFFTESTSDESDDDGNLDEGDSPSSDADGVFRLRGGATSQDKNLQLVDDPDYIVPAGIERPEGSHRTRVRLHLQLREDCLYDISISSKTAFKFQTEKAETPHELSEPISRPQLLSCVDLKVEARPVEVLLDRSYSNLGFVVHHPNSIADREYLPRGFEPPVQKATYGTQRSTQKAGSLAAGFDSMSPTIVMTASSSRTTGETIQLTEDKPAPSCHVKEQVGKEWNTVDKSYSSYDVAWHPRADTNGLPHPMKIRFGIGIEFYGREERYINKLPAISHILRNQIILWIFDPELKAKVRGMVALTTTYIPDIKIPEPLTIVEDQVVDLRSCCPPLTDSASSPQNAANSVAIGLFDERKDTVRSGLRKFMRSIAPKSSRQNTKDSILMDLPLHEYVARGWDATNEQWRNTVWPRLDASFSDTRLPSSAAWNITLNTAPARGKLDSRSDTMDVDSPPERESGLMEVSELDVTGDSECIPVRILAASGSNTSSL